MANTIYEWNFNEMTAGTTPDGWYGGCAIASGIGMAVNTQALVIGDSTTPTVKVTAAAPRADMVIPKNFNDAWTITTYMKIRSFSECFEANSIHEPLTLMTFGSMDRDDKLKLQLVPDVNGHAVFMVYPYKTTIQGDDCLYHYISIKAWDTFFNVYIDNNTVPVVQYGMPGVDPFWKSGANRMQVTFPVDGTHVLYLDSFRFETNAALSGEEIISSDCYLLKDSQGNPVVSAPIYMISADIPPNQITDEQGHFCLANIPDGLYVFAVYPTLKSALIRPDDISLARKRKAVSGSDDCCNTVVDSDGSPIAGVRLYYINTNSPSFYTDADGKFCKSSVPKNTHVFVKNGDNGSLYLDAVLFT